jgi:hypothetical protein
MNWKEDYGGGEVVWEDVFFYLMSNWMFIEIFLNTKSPWH